MDTLPDEVLVGLFGYFDFQTIHTVFSQVSARWRKLSKTESLCRKYVVEKIADINFIKKFPMAHCVETLEVKCVYITVWQTFEDLLPVFPQIRSLTLHRFIKLNNGYVDRLFKRYPDIEHINVFLENDTMMNDFISRFKKVNNIVLNNGIVGEILTNVMNKCDELKELHMYGSVNCFPKIQLNTLLTTRFQHLKRLSLRCSRLDDKTMHALFYCKSLEHLRLYHATYITDEGLLKLAALENLKLFHLTGIKLTSRKGLENLMIKMNMNKIVDINLSNTSFDDYLSQILIEQAPNLRRLEVWQCGRLSSAGIFSMSTKLKHLAILDSDLEIGIQEIFTILVLSQLEYMRVRKMYDPQLLPDASGNMIDAHFDFDSRDIRGNSDGYSANLLQYSPRFERNGFIYCPPIRKQKLPLYGFYKRIAPVLTEDLNEISYVQTEEGWKHFAKLLQKLV